MSRNATFITFMQIYARMTHVLRAQEHGDTLKTIHFTERFMQEKNLSNFVAISWKRVRVDLSKDRLSF
jgi:hypothetical protein